MATTFARVRPRRQACTQKWVGLCTGDRIGYYSGMPSRKAETPYWDIHLAAQSQAKEILRGLTKQGGWLKVMELGGPLNLPFLVRIGAEPDGELVCTGLVIGLDGQDRVTARGLRRVQLAPLLATLAGLQKMERPRGTEELYRDLPAYVPQRPGPHGLQRAHFEKVAEAYRAASLTGSPIRTISKAWNAPEASVRRWVQRARDMDLLGPPRPGKAGELAPKRRRTR
jgi:hypothetical protein